MKSSLFETVHSDATFSPCRKYRYTLIRTWDWDGPMLNFLMLNPSSADEVDNDPTVERCERRARMWGYGSLVVTNIFAWRSTDPSVLATLADPIGPDNNAHLLEAAHHASMVICAWGKDGKVLGRGAQVRKLLGARPLHYLRMNKDGQPGHPLYLPYELKPELWKAA